MNPLNEEHTVLKNKIIVAFHIYSNFDHHFILSHSSFLGLNFGAFYFFGFKFRVILFFWVVEICSQTSIPVKEMLVYPLGPSLIGLKPFLANLEKGICVLIIE